MNIAFFTEGGYTGKIPRNNPKIRYWNSYNT